MTVSPSAVYAFVGVTMLTVFPTSETRARKPNLELSRPNSDMSKYGIAGGRCRLLMSVHRVAGRQVPAAGNHPSRGLGDRPKDKSTWPLPNPLRCAMSIENTQRYPLADTCMESLEVSSWRDAGWVGVPTLQSAERDVS